MILPGGDLWRCGSCGFVFRFPLLADETYEALYRTGNLDVWDIEEQREDFRLVRDKLSVLDGQKLKVLDFGCYTGQLLKSLSKSFELFGVEPNVRAAQIAEQRGIKIVSQDAGKIENLDDRYDIIVTCDVIEHVPNPLDLLKQLRSRLKPGGLLLVSTGNCDAWLWRLTRARFWYCQFPEHISFIGNRWLKKMPSLAGLELEDLHRFNHRARNASIVRTMATLMFWLSPSLYKSLKRAISKSGSQAGTPGNGATLDHFLCVFRAT